MHFFGGYPGGAGVRLSPEQLPLVRVTGEGRLEVAPDTAEVSLGFSARADSAAAAYQQVAAAMNEVVRALREMGIPQDQMQTDQISLSPVYEKERLIGYEGSSTLRVTLRDLAAVGSSIDRAVAAGANRVAGVRFEVRDPSSYEATALAAAVQDAQRKAAQLAQSLGVRLGPVWRAEAEPSPGPVVPVMARATFAEGLPVLPGKVTLSRSVQVEYIIRYH